MKNDVTASVDNHLNQQKAENVEKNHQILKSIIEVIILCGHQNLALRGHHKDGSILESNVPALNDGNFRALLHHGAEAGDLILKNHLESCHGNACYISPQIQNEFIQICGKIIQDHIIERANAAQCFSILANEATDVSNREILCYGIWFVENAESEPSEYLLGYVHITDIAGEGLAISLLIAMKEAGLNLSYLYGQGYDGAAVMAGGKKGVQLRIREVHKNAIYTHCASHSLNLSLNSASRVVSLCLAFQQIQDICYFFDGHPQCREKLLEMINASNDNATKV